MESVSQSLRSSHPLLFVHFVACCLLKEQVRFRLRILHGTENDGQIAVIIRLTQSRCEAQKTTAGPEQTGPAASQVFNIQQAFSELTCDFATHSR